MVSIESMRDYFEASADTYGFLSKAIYKELTEEAIAELAASEWPRDTGDALLDRGYSLIRRYFKFAATDPRTQLAVEYARVFLAAGVYTPQARTAVPYESVFTGEEHLMMGESRDDVVRRFREDGFKVDPDLHEPEDHLSFEFEYLQHMSVRALEGLPAAGGAGGGAAARVADAADGRTDAAAAAAEAQAAAAAAALAELSALPVSARETLRRNAARQAEFIDKHLLNWVPELIEAVREYAKTTFYTGVLTVAWGALQQSRDFLQDVVASLDAVDDAKGR